MHLAMIENQARKLAENAKPGILQIEGKTYTFVFDMNEWVYKVYDDGFFLVNFNTKNIMQAKKWLREYLAN